MKTKQISYAYPSSIKAERYGYGENGCFVVETSDDERFIYEAREGGLESAVRFYFELEDYEPRKFCEFYPGNCKSTHLSTIQIEAVRQVYLIRKET